MFAEMRRSDRKMSRGETLELIEKSIYGVLSTVSPDGYPYGVPVHYVHQDECIYFHCAKESGLKLDHIAYNAKVCFTVVGETEVLAKQFTTNYESAVAFGIAGEVSGTKKQEVLEMLMEKYAPQFQESGQKYIQAMGGKTAVYQIRIEHLSGKARRGK